MNSPYEELIKDVLVKHGIALGEEDPILVLHTINRALADDLSTQLTEAMGALRSDLEGLYLRWDAEAKAKAERILEAATAAARDYLQAESQLAVMKASRAAVEALGSAERRLRDMARLLQLTAAALVAVLGAVAAMLAVGWIR